MIGAFVGALSGLSSYVFLWSLQRVTRFHLTHDWLLFGLPFAGLVIGLVYLYLGGRSGEGNALLLDEIHEPMAWLPRRMAPLVLLGTLWTHLFGGSVGREGTALQMAGSLSDGAARALRFGPDDRRIVLIAALAGGFGAVFGVPLAGAVFALEVQAVGRVQYEALVPALTASLIGDGIVRGLGYHHQTYAALAPHVGPLLVLKVALAGIAFGLAGAAFAWATEQLKDRTAQWMPWLPLRATVGGVVAVAFILAVGRDYSGLSVGLATTALAGHHVASWAFAAKLVATAICLGFGFVGGEVTPLFVIGATLGAALAAPLHVAQRTLAGVGFVSVFAGAANTPLACTVMAVELFGGGILVPAAVACVAAYVFSTHRGIYTTQRFVLTKTGMPLG
ncbi:MAG TPA: chloride channel protein [Acidimicrobiales bacterium]|nr:chloride channel protein [Acidimicrobiales bacterium]